MTRERDPDKGQFQAEYTDTEFLEAVHELQAGDSPPSTSNIANHISCNRETARRRLTELAEQQKLQKLEIGNSFAWTTR